jgi:ATP-dependent Clp protease ATP-binding subunit ClpA
MFERFTKRARTAVEGAVEIAEEERAEEVRPQHVFAAMLRDPDTLAMMVLADLGASTEALGLELARRRDRYAEGLGDEDAEALASIGIDLEEVLRRVDREEDGPTPRRGGHRKFAKSSKKALALSLREAISLGHNYIGTEHILLGIVRGGDTVVRDTLTACGVETGTLRGAVKEALRRAG